MAALGEILRSARQRKGVSLAEAETATRVHRKYLQALEEGNYEQLPAKVYGQGFLRTYADFLGLDKRDLLTHMDGEWAEPKPYHVEPEATYVSTPGAVTGKMVASVLLLIGVGIIAYYLFQQYSLYARSARSTSALATQLTATPVASAKQSPLAATPTASMTQVPQKSASVTPGPDQIVVETRMIDSAWLKVTTDEVVAFEGTLTGGTTRSWLGKEKIIVRTGNGAAVEVTFNGRKQGLMGARGDVIEKQWTRP